MKKIENFEKVEASSYEYKNPKAGGYVVKITLADDVPFDNRTGKGDYLKIEYDFADGEFKNYYQETFSRCGFWGGTMYRSYKENALGMFKHFIDCVEKSNAGYSWNFDETTLQGKFVGVVLGEEEYENKSGEIKKRLYVKNIKTVEQIKNGDFKILKLKELDKTANRTVPTIQAEEISDELPF